MAGEVMLTAFIRGSAAPYSMLAVPIRFPGCNRPVVKTEGLLGTAPGLSLISPLPLPIGRCVLRDTREAVGHHLGVLTPSRTATG